MDTETKLKLQMILLRGKLRQFVSEDESAFARTCWRQWPKEYSTLQTEEVIPEAEKLLPRLQINTQPNHPSDNQSNATKPRYNSALLRAPKGDTEPLLGRRA
jgi:hypothetical protein